MATSLFADDGPPGSFGPTDPHQVTPNELGQKVLVIYVQANDYRIPGSQLAALNTSEDAKRAAFAPWFGEMSWNKMTMIADAQRMAGNQWYTLPKGLLEYVRPEGVQPMELRAPGSQTLTNPSAPATVVAGAGGTGSNFAASDAGDYWYGVSSLKDGNESSMVKTSAAVAVVAGQSVTLTITRAAAADAQTFLIYRTNKGATNATANFQRVGQINVAGSSTNFTDNGIKPDALGDWSGLITDAIEAAHNDVNYDNYRGIAVVIFSPFLRGQAAGGTATFTFTGGSINIMGTFMSSTTGFGRFTHEMGHWLGLPDLYDPAGGGSIATWDTMDCACDGQYYTWEKDRGLHYLNPPGSLANVTRPAVGSGDTDQDFVIQPTEVAPGAGQITTIKIKSSDKVHYYIEGRAIIGGQNSDQAITDQRVVVIQAIDVLPSSILPQRNATLLTVLSPGAPAYQPEPGGNVQITFNGVNPGAPPTYKVHVKMKALPQPDPKIAPWNEPPWESPDIWVDSEREGGGFMDPSTAAPLPGNGEHAWVDHDNRVWAKITNLGEGAATGVKVHFKVATPGGIGDTGQYDPLPDPAPIDLAPGEVKYVFTTWKPTVGAHSCIKAEIERILGEADIYNNLGQENINDFYSGSASPWHVVQIPIDVANPFPAEKRIDLRVEGLPKGWRADIDHTWVMLPPNERKIVNLVVTPKPDAPQCTSATLNIYGMVLLDDYIQPYGGITPVIHLANPITFQVVVETDRERKTEWAARGCTTPPKPNAEIALIVADPSGHDTVTFTKTDASGCFREILKVPSTAAWTVRPYFKGDDCNAPTEGQPVNGGPGATSHGTGGGIFDSLCCRLIIGLLLICIILLFIILWLLLRRRYQADSR